MDDSGTPPLRKTVRRKFKPAQCDAQKVVAMEKVEETSGWSLKIKWFHFLFSYFAEPHAKWSAYRTGLEIEFIAFKLRNSVLVSLLPYVFEKKEDFEFFLFEVESVCHQNIYKVNNKRRILHDIATGRLDQLETTHEDIINLTRECKKLEWCNVENEGKKIVIQITKLCEKMWLLINWCIVGRAVLTVQNKSVIIIWYSFLSTILHEQRPYNVTV